MNIPKLQKIALQLGDLLAALLHFFFGGPLDLVQLPLGLQSLLVALPFHLEERLAQISGQSGGLLQQSLARTLVICELLSVGDGERLRRTFGCSGRKFLSYPELLLDRADPPLPTIFRSGAIFTSSSTVCRRAPTFRSPPSASMRRFISSFS